MKTHTLPQCRHWLSGLMAAAILLLPAIASAHPGHYHPPGEADEFDALRANFLHLHGHLEIGLLLLVVVSTIVFRVSRSRPLRLAAAIAFGGSLFMLAAH
jgi:hypothetical protein